MKKLAIAALTAAVATVSLASIAEAGWLVHDQNDWNRFDDYRYYAADYRRDDCFVKLINAFDHQGKLVVRSMRLCR